MSEKTSVSKQILLQDLGIILYTAATASGALITAMGDHALLFQNILLMMVMMLIVLLSAMRAQTAAVIVTSVTILFFAVYKLYSYLAYDTAIEWTAYLWFPLILLALAGMTLFISFYSTVEGANSILNRRIDELTVMDPTTELENMRSMVRTLSRYMALSERKGTDMGIMLIRLRYASELKKVLTAQQFSNLRHSLARVVEDTLRMEDRAFSMDENGSMGILYFSPESGAPFIKGRILSAIRNADLFPDLNERSLRVELSIVHKQYDKDMGKDAMKYIEETEREFAYEV